jgi:hypothetical protein
MRHAKDARTHRDLRAAITLCTALMVTLAAAWAAAGVTQAAAPVRAPVVHIRQSRLHKALAVASRPLTLDTGRRFTMIAVTCDAPPARRQVGLRLRAGRDGVTWGPWMQAQLEVTRSHGRALAYVDPFWTGDARFVQVAATASGAERHVRLTDVHIVTIDASVGAAGTTRGAAVADPLTTSSPVGAAVRRLSSAPPEPAIVSRAGWGADESLRKNAPVFAPVKMAFIHHTDTGNDYTAAQAPAIVRAIYAYHTQTLGWNDIGYNFLIDRYGTIYEGRYGGVDQGVVGAQVLGFNTGSTGIALIGTFSKVAPPAAALAALEDLLAWKLSLTGLDPTGTTQMTCGETQKFKAGTVVTLPVIAGHRDANSTDCPGDALYALLPAVRQAVAARMAAATPTPTPTPTPLTVTLALSATRIDAGARVTCSGSVTDADGAPASGTVTVQRRSAVSGDWTAWRTATLTGAGAYSLSARLTTAPRDWQFRAAMLEGGADDPVALSPVQSLHVGAPEPWSVTLALSAAKIRAGATVTCSGSVKTVTGLPGAGLVTVQRRSADGGSWRAWRTAALTSAGAYSVTATLTVAPREWQFRAHMAADAVNLTASSAVQDLSVAVPPPPPWQVTLNLSPARVSAGGRVRFSGRVTSAAGAPGSGAVTLQRCPASGGAWQAWKTATLDAEGRFSVTAKITTRGLWRFRARMAATASAQTGFSAPRRLLVP